jgi:ABC-type transporter Mla subunit MlaD
MAEARDGGSGAAAIMAVVVLVLVIVVLWVTGVFGGRPGDDADTTIRIETPDVPAPESN